MTIRNYRARHIQQAIRAKLIFNGAERVTIHRDGRVSAFGQMPNSDATGWWFAGFDRDIMRDLHREVAIADGRR